MMMTGKRHDFRATYEAGFDKTGRLAAVDVEFLSRCGYSADLSGPINDRTMFHADNTYFYPATRIATRRLKTHTVSNTAFRGFGGPQGMIFSERMMDAIAIKLGLDPLDVQEAQSLRQGPRRDALRHEGRRQHRPRCDRTARSLIRLPRPPRGRECLQCQVRDPPQGPCPHPRQIRHLLHPYPPQPGRRPRARLYRWLGSPQSRRHRNGAGPLHQSGPGRGRGIRHNRRSRPHHRDHHRKGAQHFGHRCLIGLRPQRHGGQGRRLHHQVAPRSLRRQELESRQVAHPLRKRPGHHRQPVRSASAISPRRPTRPASHSHRPATMQRPRSLGTATRPRAAPSITSPMARPAPKSPSIH